MRSGVGRATVRVVSSSGRLIVVRRWLMRACVFLVWSADISVLVAVISPAEAKERAEGASSKGTRVRL